MTVAVRLADRRARRAAPVMRLDVGLIRRGVHAGRVARGRWQVCGAPVNLAVPVTARLGLRGLRRRTRRRDRRKCIRRAVVIEVPGKAPVATLDRLWLGRHAAHRRNSVVDHRRRSSSTTARLPSDRTCVRIRPMRWNGQQVGEQGVGTAQTLPGLSGLLRTVRTPEFAGVVFHEVEARSALNRVPGSSPVPFRWTVNPYRGCAHACVYCLAGPTRVLLADGSTRPIAELRVGDVVLGTDRVDGVRRYVPTRVLAHWSTTKPAYVVRLAGGTELVTSGEHRFLTANGWRHVSGGWCRAGRRPHLRPGSPLLGPGAFGPDRPAAQAGSHSAGYRRGYLCGLVRGEGPDFPSERLALEA